MSGDLNSGTSLGLRPRFLRTLDRYQPLRIRSIRADVAVRANRAAGLKTAPDTPVVLPKPIPIRLGEIPQEDDTCRTGRRQVQKAVG